MPLCPVCGQDVDADSQAFQYHVNAHLDEPSSSRSRRPSPPTVTRPQSPPPDFEDTSAACIVCAYPLDGLPAEQRQRHVNACLDEGLRKAQIPRDSANTSPEIDITVTDETQQDRELDWSQVVEEQPRDDDWVEVEWDGPAKPGGWHGWVDKKPHKGDGWWDPVKASSRTRDIPSNFSPGLLDVMTDLLRKSTVLGHTRSAVLCRDTVHMKGYWMFDMGWGCGYRNALMALSSLLAACPEYRPAFSRDRNGADPGVRRLQGWIEEAWGAGHDPPGRAHFRGKVLGTRKWIGTSDLYAMYTYKGVPCNLYDFPKAKDKEKTSRASWHLQQFVKEYFSDSTSTSRPNGANAFDMLMRTNEGGQGRGEAVRRSNKFPLVLQHAGHSRTIVGYEETTNGTINLLLFDPGRSVPKALRSEAISRRAAPPKIKPRLQAEPGLRRSLTESHETLRFSRPYSNGASEIITPTLEVSVPPRSVNGDDGVNRLNGGSALLESDEEMDQGGWVRKKIAKSVKRAMGGVTGKRKEREEVGVDCLDKFRVGLGGLNWNSEFQVLAFTGGPLLSPSQREQRKILSSTVR